MARQLLDRRAFLATSGAAFVASLAPARAEALERAGAVFASAYADGRGGFGAALLTERGDLLATVPLPSRGHDIACHKASGRAFAFARRPGTIAVAFDRDGRTAPQSIVAPSGRHFYGHGVYSPDGKLLYASENNFDGAAGVVGVYDVEAGYSRIGEFSSGGVGPHDMLLLGDGRTLAIANGGIETHPDFGRAKLNLATMAPSLCFVDRIDGSLIERQALPAELHRLSIRHLARDGRNGVYFACQFEGSPTERPPLCGRAVPGQDIRLFEMEPQISAKLKNYVGSIAANRQAGTVAISSPRGNCMMVLDGRTGRVIGQRHMHNVCGVAEMADGYIASTGDGVLFSTSGGNVDGGMLHWDNHMLRVAG
ncbi:DUF1513 domain-containing protein [Nitratireductor sp. XY-223]|uniref:DUF1513 domain-containing protein n=1 Tax=Nitratireductor sp. XY-223 TaxID=2561926 RepID=UPI00145AE1A6|nr:DUF1513 domain-containing protein [Nitratireductor sp. XY-223]